ncbi:hypothetical protein I6H88_09150 [Elizabethkingia bruuniana]|uniref:Uncharacterized protein n=1 Tax=Elizabethkingia bruuniana TaxID=1756149 RepID=A0A7T7ZZQ3_9FLAO|nr:hypothetical protein [Elizabethkingia bruuniana]KGO08199.1 hypothetical protein KS04_20445 [Elizabethkingia miricola]AQX86989.1 hypothetical protein AYC65_19120 [Elizabethkingia bruuniana]KUY26765.1 hypothetical protein ATB97_04470 [Elizabethkingia bruuniana]OPB66793.1 hypothetical protein BAY12_04680 [Elizabethkingia bruuniana]QQN60718.1 hypothetical protein I6H88_09150 [Elizabethkingia bruuniana]
MIYISAQPDQIYFLWQLEIQLRNFQSLGIKKDDIHVIIGYNPLTELKENSKIFIKENKDFAHFFVYPDTRNNPKYESSIRPHLLEKHWIENPDIRNETIFYHDSDILFSRIPSINQELNDHINYVSDTRSYLDSVYILSHTDEKVFKKITSTVGISVQDVTNIDENAGGAQYILKNVDSHFWRKVYSDSETIYTILSDYNTEELQKSIINPDYQQKKIQAWCSDMWSLLWNLIYLDREIKILQELNFSWPTDDIKEWSNKAILHYAGLHTDKENYFYKRDYVHHTPWYDDNIDSIPPSNCSYPIVELIKRRKEELDTKRIILENIVLSPDEQTEIQKKYVEKYFFSADIATFCKPVLTIPQNLIIPPELLQKIDKLIGENQFTEIQLHHIYHVDLLISEVFNKVQDAEILSQNKGKFQILDLPVTINIKYPNCDSTDKKVLEITNTVFELS